MSATEAALATRSIETTERGDFAALLNREFRPKSERAKEEVESAVRTLAEQVLNRSDVVGEDVSQTIKAYIAEIDRTLTEQLNQILHHADLQQLEGAWRGLHYLVNNTETDQQLKIRVLNISKKELGKVLKRYKGTAWDQSPIFKKVYEQEYGQLGGEPYGCLVGDYYFDQSPPDVELLNGIAQVAAAAHAPFIAAAAPKLMGMDNWSELSNPRDLAKIFPRPITLHGARCANPKTPSTSVWPCRARSRVYLTARPPARWKTSISRKTPPARIPTSTPGRMPPMRWR